MDMEKDDVLYRACYMRKDKVLFEVTGGLESLSELFAFLCTHGFNASVMALPLEAENFFIRERYTRKGRFLFDVVGDSDDLLDLSTFLHTHGFGASIMALDAEEEKNDFIGKIPLCWRSV